MAAGNYQIGGQQRVRLTFHRATNPVGESIYRGDACYRDHQCQADDDQIAVPGNAPNEIDQTSHEEARAGLRGFPVDQGDLAIAAGGKGQVMGDQNKGGVFLPIEIE